jgi:CheY-like chemotaxis protein
MTDVLIVDDDAAVRAAYQRLLERAGFQVTAVENALAAIGELESRRFDAIVCDLELPFLKGHTFHEELRQTFPAMADRVVFVTGWAHDPVKGARLHATGRPVLQKPVEFDELVEIVRRVATGAEHGVPVVSGRIVLVDDDVAVRDLLGRFLRGAGYDVEDASNGAGAIAACRRQPADLVITDLYMPGVDGIEAMIRLQAEFPGVRIIAMSGGGYLDKKDALESASSIGARRTLAKPIRREDLLEAVAAVLKTP